MIPKLICEFVRQDDLRTRASDDLEWSGVLPSE